MDRFDNIVEVMEKLEENLNSNSNRNGYGNEVQVEYNVPMSAHTSFRAGGNAAAVLIPKDRDALKESLKFLSDRGAEHIVMANGTNVLVRDEGYAGVIIKLGSQFEDINVEGVRVNAHCGASLAAVARVCQKNGLTGFEFASGIPGSIGGAVFMNAGAYDGEMKAVMESATVLSGDGSVEKVYSKDELELGYRRSVLQQRGGVVLDVVLKLERGDKGEILKKMKDLNDRRNRKQPINYPSAGSFFKRPEGYFAGKLIQDAGLKGESIGGASVSTLHSGFIVNTGGATATDIISLMELIRNRVRDEFGVQLEPEVRIIGG